MMSSSLSKREVNRQRWVEHIQAWKQSSQSQKVFCEQHHLGLSSFQRWRRKLIAQEKSNGTAAVSFLPVSVMGPSDSGLTLLINDQLRIEISTSFDANTLKQVIGIVQAT
jgi:hypothetical protein